ncbi:MAG TPA: deoxyguanosinetriphosphate triphosphohydrolase [Actinomycetales bacterium]|nr:deoxyguanosinetriphosphate triphosphohydrolase [Actinomycetales bacterium]
MTGYAATDRARWVQEPAKRSTRGEFARDRARIVHSSALRRLGGKTQVVGPGTDDFARTRLTHSLEVAQVGRELAAALGCDSDVVEGACLAHDLGHPPFGHHGERVLAGLTSRVGGFEGNAQTLRLLTRLEPKVADPVTGRGAGLNLTRASLDAATKYPWASGEAPGGGAKFGVYADDADVFAWLRQGAPPAHRCLEAQVMDLADDVAYSVHDVEDAVVGGWLDPAVLRDAGRRRDVTEIARSWYLPEATDDELHEALAALRGSDFWVDAVDGSRRGQAALKDMTSRLIGRFCGAVEAVTRTSNPDGPLTRYAADLVVPAQTATEIGVLKAVAALFVMTADDRRRVYDRQAEVVTELVGALADRAPDALEPVYASDFAAAGDDDARLRTVVDQVASLTDVRALDWHDRLVGSSRAANSMPG